MGKEAKFLKKKKKIAQDKWGWGEGERRELKYLNISFKK